MEYFCNIFLTFICLYFSDETEREARRQSIEEFIEMGKLISRKIFGQNNHFLAAVCLHFLRRYDLFSKQTNILRQCRRA